MLCRWSGIGKERGRWKYFIIFATNYHSWTIEWL